MCMYNKQTGRSATTPTTRNPTRIRSGALRWRAVDYSGRSSRLRALIGTIPPPEMNTSSPPTASRSSAPTWLRPIPGVMPCVLSPSSQFQARW